MNLKLKDTIDDLFLVKPLGNETYDTIGVYGEIKKAKELMINVTYDELCDLVDNEELVKGKKYRITDYVTTTSQENTRSAKHPFDIVVTALDEKTLDENARAIQHEGDTYFSDVNMDAWEIKYRLRDEVEIDGDTVHNFTWSGGEGATLCLKTTKNEGAVTNDFYYVGTFEYNNTDYYMWKNVPNTIVGSTTLSADHDADDDEVVVGNKARAWLNVSNVSLFSVGDIIEIPDTEGGDGKPLRLQVEQVDTEHYVITVFSLNGVTIDGIPNRTPYIDVDETIICIGQMYYGLTETLYQPGSLSPTNTATFDYAGRIDLQGELVEYQSDENLLVGVQMQAVDDVDAETSPFFRGVIYYMKDEWNNECPYDFKNIQFKRWAIINVTSTTLPTDALNSLKAIFVYNNSTQPICFAYQSSNITSGSATFVVSDASSNDFYYTFTWIDENKRIHDASIVGQTLQNDDGLYSGVYGNCIKPSGEYNTIGGDGESFRFVLPSNAFVYSYAYEGGVFYGIYGNNLGVDCYNNTFGNHCYNNSFGNDCFGNLFGNDCYGNSFGNDCYGNSFGYSCYNNSFGNECLKNSFGYSCYNNSFGNECTHNSFGNTCYGNSFGNECTHNSFGNTCYGNSFGNLCQSNSFGNRCQYNSFGNECQSNSFGYRCQDNSFGNRCQDNSFGNTCGSNSFGNTCYSNSFGENCVENSFGNQCAQNSFGNTCCYNSFGNVCGRNSFGNTCYGNSFGNTCFNITFNKQYTLYCIIENGNSNITLTTTQTTSDSTPLRNIQISLGVNNTIVTKAITHPTVNDAFKTIYANNTNGELVSWNPADHVIPQSYT